MRRAEGVLHRQPVIIVLDRGSRGLAPAAPCGALGGTLNRALATELPVVLAARADVADAARGLMALRDIVVPPGTELNHNRYSAPDAGLCIACAVAARPQASGWVVLPGDMPLVRPHTILAVARALSAHPATYAQHGGRVGQPAGFSAELYSELIGLSGNDAARRLLARYPAHAVEVDDPGVLPAALGAQAAPGPFKRTQL